MATTDSSRSLPDTSQTETGDGEVLIERVFDAPREAVFRAFTQADALARWWSPLGFTTIRAELDLRPGGEFRYGWRMDNGIESYGKWVLREIAPPDRLAFLNLITDTDGNPIPHPMIPDWPVLLNVVTFVAEDGGRTRVTMRGRPDEPSASAARGFAAGREMMAAGLGNTFDKLAEYLASQGGR